MADWLNLFVDELARTIVQIAAVIIAPLVVAVVVQVLRRVGLSVEAERQAKIEKVVRDAILRVEEWAAARARQNAPVKSAQKLERALTDVVDRVPGISREEAAALVHQELPKVGTGAVAALTRLRQAATTGAS